jgi:hypothetical protein
MNGRPGRAISRSRRSVQRDLGGATPGTWSRLDRDDGRRRVVDVPDVAALFAAAVDAAGGDEGVGHLLRLAACRASRRLGRNGHLAADRITAELSSRPATVLMPTVAAHITSPGDPARGHCGAGHLLLAAPLARRGRRSDRGRHGCGVFLLRPWAKAPRGGYRR